MNIVLLNMHNVVLLLLTSVYF